MKLLARLFRRKTAKLTRGEYNIYAALRGPDSPVYSSHILKYIFTARIRYWVGMGDFGPTVRRKPQLSYTARDIIGSLDIVKSSKFNTTHFLSHIKMALRAMVKQERRYTKAERAEMMALSILAFHIQEYLSYWYGYEELEEEIDNYKMGAYLR